MDFKEASKYSTLEIYKSLSSSEKGLSDSQAKENLQKFGENKIKTSQTTSWQIFLRQFKSPFVYLLFASFLISFWLGEKLDAGMILLFVGINTALGFYQEYKSQNAVRLLKKYLVSKVKVKRDGKLENIETEKLVLGDLIALEPGDIIPADVRFIQTSNLIVDEEVLTGESQPVPKFSEVVGKVVKEIYDAENIGFSGTTIVGGKAEAVVIATGENTNYAKIVALTSETERESTFEEEISRFSKFTMLVILASLVFVVVTSIALKPNPSLIELTLFAIALTVSVIPEALPVVTTFSLSIGAVSLAKKKVVVKRLSAINDLGAVEVLCSDKTGTLTENKLTVTDVNSEKADRCLLAANLPSGDITLSRNTQSNAFDAALLSKLDNSGKSELKDFQKLDELPFDPARRRVTVLVSANTKKILVSRGSPEEILEICRLSRAKKDELLKWTSLKGIEGKRVLAVAEKILKTGHPGDLKALEEDLDFLGLVAFSDPIKDSAYAAISAARSLGVKVKIITGDGPEVAGSVAQEIKLVENPGEVITGTQFEALNLDEKHKAVEKYQVFARVNPAQKYDIIKLLQEKYSVGFLGEGINDAPALKIANVAIVVAGASDVAREASDIVLMEQSLKVILDGIEGGRRVFANTSKYITATMASNFGNFFAVALVAPFIEFLPMLPLQILLVNLLSDFPMIMVATDTVDDDVIKMPKRYNLKSFAVNAFGFGAISTVFDFTTFSIFFHMGEKHLQTYWFIESILTELVFLFSVRTLKPLFKTKMPSKPLIYLTFLGAFFTVFIPFTEMGENIFGFIHPQIKELTLVGVIVIAYIASNETAKWIIRRYQKA